MLPIHTCSVLIEPCVCLRGNPYNPLVLSAAMSGDGSVVDKWVQGVFEHTPMQIFVKTVTGKTITLDVERSFMMEDVKVLIKSKLGIDPLEQRIMYRGRTLSHPSTLAELGISHGVTLELSLQLRGGATGATGGTGDDVAIAASVYDTVNNNNVVTIGQSDGSNPNAQRLGYRGPLSALARILIEANTPMRMRIEAYEHFYMLTRNQQSPMLDTFRQDLQWLNYLDELWRGRQRGG